MIPPPRPRRSRRQRFGIAVAQHSAHPGVDAMMSISEPRQPRRNVRILRVLAMVGFAGAGIVTTRPAAGSSVVFSSATDPATITVPSAHTFSIGDAHDFSLNAPPIAAPTPAALPTRT